MTNNPIKKNGRYNYYVTEYKNLTYRDKVNYSLNNTLKKPKNDKAEEELCK